MNTHDNKCQITCTDNDIVNEAEVDRFEEKKFVEVFIAQNRLKLLWNGSVYVWKQIRIRIYYQRSSYI